MTISSQLKTDIIKVANITMAFILTNIFFTFYNDGLLNNELSLGPTDIYDINFNYLMNSFTGLIAGILGGSALVFVNKTYFRKKSYGYALRATFIVYTIVFVIVTVTMSFLNSILTLGSQAGWVEIFKYASMFMLSQMAFVYYLFWGTISIITLIFLQISDKFGPGMFFNFLVGKYHQPIDEQRIFMFMDMKSSTTIAERIGNKKYFNLLNELYTDITDDILASEGEIYQYVGDEIVVSWNLEKGVNRANCIKCFQNIKKNLVLLGPYYESKYDVIPEFKAGIHHGEVTAGEMGSIKRDVAYSGDVLNTTSRIQEQCNQYEVDFLISGDTIQLLGDKISFNPVHLGKIELRGKSQTVDLNTLAFAASSV